MSHTGWSTAEGDNIPSTLPLSQIKEICLSIMVNISCIPHPGVQLRFLYLAQNMWRFLTVTGMLSLSDFCALCFYTKQRPNHHVTISF